MVAHSFALVGILTALTLGAGTPSCNQVRMCLKQAAFDEAGSIMVEYTVLLSVVAVGLCFAIAALGVPLIRMYLSQKTWLLLPFP